MTIDGDPSHDPIAERLGIARARALQQELAAAGLALVDAVELAVLQREAEGYRRMRALVDEPDEAR